jgi:LacI family transcriptional regulator
LLNLLGNRNNRSCPASLPEIHAQSKAARGLAGRVGFTFGYGSEKGLASSRQALLNFFSNLIGVLGFVKQVVLGAAGENPPGENGLQKRVKMIDVARQAQVSQTTVSLVLNNIAGIRIAEETRQRVIDTARRLGYTPGPSLRDLDPAGGKIIGVLINEISSAYPIDIIDGLHLAARAQGAQLAIFVTDGTVEREARALQTLQRLEVSGVIYANTFTTGVYPTEALRHLPHVHVNCFRNDRTGIAVIPGERAAGFVAAGHLADIGRKRIATITGDAWHTSAERRLAGFRRGLKASGLTLDDAYLKRGDWSHRSGRAAMAELLALPQRPDAVFCQNDMMARGALEVIAEAGLTVPHNIAVLGFDDREFARDLSLSTLLLPHAAMAERAMQLLTRAGGIGPDATISMRCKLIVRGTTETRASAA